LLITFRDPADDAALEQVVRRATHAEQRDRYRAALLAARGEETLSIIETLARSRGFVQRWAYAYRDGGTDALRAKPRGGRKPRLSAEQQRQFYQRVVAGPTDADGGLCTLRGKDARRILEREFGQAYSLGGAYDLLRRVGLSCLRPRPRHRKNDPAAMKQWLDDAPPFSTP